MKKIIFCFLLFSNFTFSQGKVELPLKNEMILFQTDYTLKNESKCLSKYFESVGTSFYMKLLPLVNQVFKTKELSSKDYTGMMATVHDQLTLNCSDTISNGSMLFSLNIPPSVMNLQIDKAPKKSNQRVEASIQIIFKDKNSYSIKFKGFLFKYVYMEKGIAVTKEIPLEDIYTSYQSSTEKSKELTNFLSDLKIIVLDAHNLINETLIKAHKVDDI